MLNRERFTMSCELIANFIMQSCLQVAPARQHCHPIYRLAERFALTRWHEAAIIPPYFCSPRLSRRESILRSCAANGDGQKRVGRSTLLFSSVGESILHRTPRAG